MTKKNLNTCHIRLLIGDCMVEVIGRGISDARCTVCFLICAIWDQTTYLFSRNPPTIFSWWEKKKSVFPHRKNANAVKGFEIVENLLSHFSSQVILECTSQIFLFVSLSVFMSLYDDKKGTVEKKRRLFECISCHSLWSINKCYTTETPKLNIKTYKNK